jgi:hypothetical protein
MSHVACRPTARGRARAGHLKGFSSGARLRLQCLPRPLGVGVVEARQKCNSCQSFVVCPLACNWKVVYLHTCPAGASWGDPAWPLAGGIREAHTTSSRSLKCAHNWLNTKCIAFASQTATPPRDDEPWRRDRQLQWIWPCRRSGPVVDLLPSHTTRRSIAV